MRFLFKIEYHYSQADHAFATNIEKISVVPDASGMLVGLLEDQQAPDRCPGIHPAMLQPMPVSGTPNGFSSLSIVNHTKTTSNIPGFHSTPTTKTPSVQSKPSSASFTESKPTSSTSRIPSSLPTAKVCAISAVPLLPLALPGMASSSSKKPFTKPSASQSESLKAALALNSEIPDLPLLPKGMSIVPEEAEKATNAKPSKFHTDWVGPAFCIPHGEFEVRMVLDIREVRGGGHDRAYLMKELLKLGVPCITRNLDVADATWIAVRSDGRGEEIVLDFLVERKRLDDLVGSIRDGRFQEQKVTTSTYMGFVVISKIRLLNSGVTNVFYLVEDYDFQGIEQFGRDALRTAMTTIQTLTGMFVKRTNGVDDTVRFFARMTDYILRFYMV